MRVYRAIAATAATIAVLALPAAAQADNYGTSKGEAARMTALIYKTFGTGYTGQCMVKIMWRESGGNPRAANYTDVAGGSYGLLQLNGVHRWRGETLAQFQRRMWNPHTHLIAAKRLARGGLHPWGGC